MPSIYTLNGLSQGNFTGWRRRMPCQTMFSSGAADTRHPTLGAAFMQWLIVFSCSRLREHFDELISSGTLTRLQRD
jgi:hypothetical protein